MGTMVVPTPAAPRGGGGARPEPGLPPCALRVGCGSARRVAGLRWQRPRSEDEWARRLPESAGLPEIAVFWCDGVAPCCRQSSTVTVSIR